MNTKNGNVSKTKKKKKNSVTTHIAAIATAKANLSK